MQQDRKGSSRGAIAALIVLAVLILGGLWLSRHLRQQALVQDCVMQGRTNCAPGP